MAGVSKREGSVAPNSHTTVVDTPRDIPAADLASQSLPVVIDLNVNNLGKFSYPSLD